MTSADMSAPQDETATAERRRRRADAATLGTIAASLPMVVLSALIVLLIISPLGTTDMWLAFAAYVASGALAFVPAAESVIARSMLGYRPPRLSESQAVTAAWTRVAATAGVRGSSYRLWVQNSDEINAGASAGHIIGVTSEALRATSGRDLEALIAHELGHHLGGHAWAAFLTYWYSIPARIVGRLLRIAGRVLRVIWGAAAGALGAFELFEGGAMAGCIGVLAVGLVGVVVVASGLIVFATNPIVWVFVVAALAGAWFRRLGEHRADRTAVRLGYGPDLLRVLSRWEDQGGDDRRGGPLAVLFASHPTLRSRIARVQRRTQATGGEASDV